MTNPARFSLGPGAERALLFLGVGLLALRFGSSFGLAYLAVSGVNTSGLEGLAGAFGILVPFVLFAILGVLAIEHLGSRAQVRLIAAAVLSAIVGVQWAGVLVPALRVLVGPASDLILGLTVAATLVAFAAAFDATLAGPDAGPQRRTWFRGFTGAFAAAYAWQSFTLVDYSATLGLPIPSGLAWLLAYGATLLLCVAALTAWWSLGWPDRTRRGLARRWLPPLFGAALGALAPIGIGGFLLSHLLAWGGGYTTFPPYEVSLGIVGLAAGAYLAIALALRQRLPRRSWQLIVGGAATAAFAGLQPLAGSLGSLAGLSLAMAWVARGLARPTDAGP